MIAADHAAELTARHGSPLYVYDLGVVARRAAELRRLAPSARLLYSLKANPLVDIARELRSLGWSAEVSSQGELAVAQAAGFGCNEILYTGPGKTDAEIEQALEAGVAWFSCESWGELRRLRARAPERERWILLRVNARPGVRSGLAMTGRSTQFGIPEEDVLTADLSAGDRRALAGVHGYSGTQVVVESLPETFRAVAASAIRVAEGLGLDTPVVDLGGGFPWPFGRTGETPALPGAAAAIAEALDGPWPGGRAEAWLESGRYAVASAGTLLTRVTDLKRGSDGRWFAVLDAGINALSGMSGLSRLTPAQHDARTVVQGPGRRCDGRATLVGPLCTPLDRLAADVAGDELAQGSLLAIPNVGAYGLTASLVAFLGRPCPPEVVVRGRDTLAVRRLEVRHEPCQRRDA